MVMSIKGFLGNGVWTAKKDGRKDVVPSSLEGQWMN
jgi:hypothetical protein